MGRTVAIVRLAQPAEANDGGDGPPSSDFKRGVGWKSLAVRSVGRVAPKAWKRSRLVPMALSPCDGRGLGRWSEL